MSEEYSSLLHPKPQRPYDLTSISSQSSATSTHLRHSNDSSRVDTDEDGEKPVSRTRSLLNLTSSTLFGIYTPSTSSHETNRDEPSTPLANRTFTPARASIDDTRPPVIGAWEFRKPNEEGLETHHIRIWQNFIPLSERVILLFCFGMAYGVIISHLHKSEQVVPVPVDLKGVEQGSWGYLMGWGGVGVALGALLPWVDILWEEVLGIEKDVFSSQPLSERALLSRKDSEEQKRLSSKSGNTGSGLGGDWSPVVRSVGAFVGIAFAIRRLPWQSTSQVSLTLALVNPVLWYLVDRSKPGFLLSLLVGLAGTAIAFGVNPEIVPPPAAPSPRVSPSNVLQDYGLHDGLISNESIGIGTWIASVLFCSSVCFGNIGRRLAIGTANRKPSVS